MSYNVGTAGVLGSTLYRNICNGIRYDEATFQAVTELQKKWERPTDGVLRPETWRAFLNN